MSAQTTVEVKLSQLLNAANVCDQCATNIKVAVDTTDALVGELMALGYRSEAATVFSAAYKSAAKFMIDWPVDLKAFSTGLRAAVNDIKAAQQAIHDHAQDAVEDLDIPETTGVPVEAPDIPDYPSGDGSLPDVPTSGGSGHHGGGKGNQGNGRGARDTEPLDTEDGEPPTTSTEEVTDPNAPGYLSAANQVVYNQLQDTQTNLAAAQTGLTTLQQNREDIDRQIADLQVRLDASGGTNQNTANTIKALQEQLAQIDDQIATEQSNVDALQSQAETLSGRLATVMPGAGADLNKIAELEGGRTIQAILDATHQSDNSVNCVNYVCNRMPIPPGIPNNAYLWVENAQNHPEYGITVGQKPLVGSVIVMQPEHSFGDDRFGHVMYVERVDSDGSIWITDNLHPGTPVRLNDLTDELTGPNIEYMYFPWQTQA